MITTAREIGNSLGVLIGSPVRQRIDLRKGDTLSVSVINGAIVMRPLSPRSVHLLKNVPELLRTHSDALRDLGAN